MTDSTGIARREAEFLHYDAADGKSYKTRFYDLDAIIAVG
jgi:hypothetical protein